MDAIELRIGNLFNRIIRTQEVHIPESIPFKIIELKLFTVSYLLPEQNPSLYKEIPKIHYSDICGITLTEEWLLKSDLKVDIGSKAYRKGDFCVIAWPTGIFTIEFKNIEIKQVEFVHDLQNTKFALTGEELTIK